MDNLILLSVLFTLVIILSFYFTVLNSIKQKNISEMKTDFINNMTHEFKTPIATIDLALNAIRTDEIKLDKKMKSKYLSVIDEENKRMNNQVENVLKISQLDNSKISFIKNDILVFGVGVLSCGFDTGAAPFAPLIFLLAKSADPLTSPIFISLMTSSFLSYIDL